MLLKPKYKKKISKCLVMYQSGISSFVNGSSINVTINEIEEFLLFENANKSTAKLAFNKIESLSIEQKLNTHVNSTGAALFGGLLSGTTGAVIGATMGNKSAGISILVINYQSNDTLNQIKLYPCAKLESSINLIHMILQQYLTNKITQSNVEL